MHWVGGVKNTRIPRSSSRAQAQQRKVFPGRSGAQTHHAMTCYLSSSDAKDMDISGGCFRSKLSRGERINRGAGIGMLGSPGPAGNPSLGSAASTSRPFQSHLPGCRSTARARGAGGYPAAPPSSSPRPPCSPSPPPRLARSCRSDLELLKTHNMKGVYHEPKRGISINQSITG